VVELGKQTVVAVVAVVTVVVVAVVVVVAGKQVHSVLRANATDADHSRSVGHLAAVPGSD
jgi:hypothetical protein